MFNVIRNNISKINAKEKLLNTNFLTENNLNFITNKNLFNNFNKFNFLTTYKSQINKFTENNILKNQKSNSSLKINKIASHNFFWRLMSIKPIQPQRSVHTATVQNFHSIYDNLIEEVKVSKNFNEDEKNALLEKLENFVSSHNGLDDQREFQDYAEIYLKIKKESQKEANQNHINTLFNNYDAILNSKFIYFFFLNFYIVY